MKNISLAFILSFVFSFLAASAHAAESYQSRIKDLDLGAKVSYVYLESEGRVLRISAKDAATLASLQSAYQNGEQVTLSVNDKGSYDQVVVLNHQPVTAPVASPFSSSELSLSDDAVEPYSPTDFGTLENANSWFRRQEYDMKQKSQCYQRAHNWAWMMWKMGGLKTQKTFIFFTRRYIREYDYKWWFHVAPVATVQGQPMVMDRSFTRTPLALQSWKNLFMKNNAQCPIVNVYSGYSTKQEEAYCYLMLVPMYYYQPLNVENLEKGVEVGAFQSWELKNMLGAMRHSVYRKWRDTGLFDEFDR